MNLSEIAVASAIGLTAIYFGRVVLLNSVRSWHNKGHIDVPSAPTQPVKSERPIGCSQVFVRDHRQTIEAVSNQGVHHSGTRHRRRK